MPPKKKEETPTKPAAFATLELSKSETEALIRNQVKRSVVDQIMAKCPEFSNALVGTPKNSESDEVVARNAARSEAERAARAR